MLPTSSDLIWDAEMRPLPLNILHWGALLARGWFKGINTRDFSGSTVVKNWCFQCRGAVGLIPDMGIKTPKAVRCALLPIKKVLRIIMDF